MANFAASFRGDDERPRVLASALVVSLLAHLALFFVLQLGTQLGWWQSSPLESLARVTLTPEEQARIEHLREQALRPPPDDAPITFVQVAEPSADTPERTPLYSSTSSRAANPDPARETAQPQVDGAQTRIVKAETTPRTLPGPAAPPAPPAEPSPAEAAAAPQLAARPRPSPPTAPETPRPDAPIADQAAPERPAGLGRLARATPETRTEEALPDNQPAGSARPRQAKPRTVAEAKARQPWLAGEKMRQEGGVARRAPVSFDVKGLPFGAYDEAMFAAIQAKWFELIEESRYAGDAGRVVLDVKLYPDGSVRVPDARDTTVDALLTAWCIRAVTDPAPFGRWPPDMARMVGRSFRDLTITFYYQ